MMQTFADHKRFVQATVGTSHIAMLSSILCVCTLEPSMHPDRVIKDGECCVLLDTYALSSHPLQPQQYSSRVVPPEQFQDTISTTRDNQVVPLSFGTPAKPGHTCPAQALQEDRAIGGLVLCCCSLLILGELHALHAKDASARAL